jgi:hypothetical protein
VDLFAMSGVCAAVNRWYMFWSPRISSRVGRQGVGKVS